MNIAYIFDVDGTLTPSRSKIDPAFAEWFLEFQASHDTYLVTGSDLPKTEEQVGPKILSAAKMVFNCCGNEVRQDGKVIYQSKWRGPQELIEALEHELEICSFRLRTGQHIEQRTGLINFSVVGRAATPEQRREYIEYDSTRFERRSLITRLSNRFRDIEFAIAGEIGIDIYPRGKDKAQVLSWIKADHTVFFGDAIYPAGNDWPIAVKCDEKYRVDGWLQTWDLLRRI